MSISEDYEPRFSGFHDLTRFRVREILLVSSLYDAFILEEDGRLSEKIIGEYEELNLRFIPRITRVSRAEDALKIMEERQFDLILTMTRITGLTPISFGNRVKESDPEMPVIMLTYEPLDQAMLERIREAKSIDKVFFWSVDTKLLLGIIKIPVTHY